MAGVLDPFRDQLINPRPMVGGTGTGAFVYQTRSSDDSPAVFTSVANRDNYYGDPSDNIPPGTADGNADLAILDSPDGLSLIVGIGPTDGSSVGVTQAFARRLDDQGVYQWVEASQVLQGATGPTGPQGNPGADGADGADGQGIDFNNTTADTLLRTNSANNAAVSSSLSENGSQIDAVKQLAVPDSEGVMFGAIQVINGGFNIAAVTLDNRTFFPVATELQSSGSARAIWIKFAGQTTTPSPANISETFTGTQIQFRVINANDGLANRYTFNSVGAVNNVNLIIRATSHTGSEIFNYQRATGGTGFNLIDGENQITLPGVGLFFRQNQELFVTIAPASGNISLRGQTIDVGGQNETFPYAEVLGRLSTDFLMLTTDAGEINALVSKSNLADADVLVGEDSANGFAKVKIPVSALPSGAVAIEDDGTQIVASARTINFTGGSVAATQDGSDPNQVNVAISATGLAGVNIRDEGNVLTTAATTLNFTGAGVTATGTGETKTINIPGATGTTPTPSLHNLSIDIPSRVDLNTDLNVQHTVTFDVSNHSQLTALTLIVTDGDDKTLTNPIRDGQQSQTVTLSGINTSTTGTVTFQLSGTHAGGTVTSNIVTVNVANVAAHEMAYYGARQTNDFATAPTGELTSVDVQNSGTVYTLSQQVANGEFFGILSPENRDPTSIIDTVLNSESLSGFTAATNVRTIGTENYNLLTIQNNSGFTGTFSYRVTTE